MDKTQRASSLDGEGQGELDDSWFDLPVIVELPAKKPRAARRPEDDLDDSWFDRPGRGIRRSDVIGR